MATTSQRLKDLEEEVKKIKDFLKKVTKPKEEKKPTKTTTNKKYY